MAEMITDTHAHYDDAAFDEDREQILAGMREKGIGRIIDVASDLASAQAVTDLAQEVPFLYAAVGVHPSETMQLDEQSYQHLKELCGRPKVVAVGEIGLDYHWPEPGREVQKNWFRRQLALAREMDLPVSIHSRDAAQDTLTLMQEEPELPRRGSIHCFSYSKEVARTFTDMGYYFGIGGVVTFKNARKLREVVTTVPMNRILLETDCPYLAPEPYRGSRNSSVYLQEVAEAVAQLRGMTRQEVIDITTENARELFRLP